MPIRAARPQRDFYVLQNKHSGHYMRGLSPGVQLCTNRDRTRSPEKGIRLSTTPRQQRQEADQNLPGHQVCVITRTNHSQTDTDRPICSLIAGHRDQSRIKGIDSTTPTRHRRRGMTTGNDEQPTLESGAILKSSIRPRYTLEELLAASDYSQAPSAEECE